MSIEFVGQEVDEIAREIDLLETSGLKSAGTAVLRQGLELARKRYAQFLDVPCISRGMVEWRPLVRQPPCPARLTDSLCHLVRAAVTLRASRTAGSGVPLAVARMPSVAGKPVPTL
jgi:hypothetical protein